ncbi:hypothetical protein J7M00_02075 [bacterium]|nr:hypothetical protein [bacterium]
MLTKSKNIVPAIAIVSVAILAAKFFIILELMRNGKTGLSSDDAYIFLTYAKNFLRGHLFQFNIGETSWGVTSTMWTILIIPFVPIGIIAIKSLGALLLGFTAYFVFRIAKIFSENETTSFLAALLTIFAGPSIFHSISGMDTLLFALFVVASIFLYLKIERYEKVLLIMCILSPFVRPEGILVVLLITISSIFEHNFKYFLKFIIAGLLAMLSFGIFTLVLTGSPLPPTFYSKHTSFNLAYFETLLSSLRNDFSLLFFLPLFAFIPLAMRALSKRHRPSMVLFLAGIILPFGLALGSGAFEPLDRYSYFLLPIWAIFSAIAANSAGKIFQNLYSKLKSDCTASLILTAMLILSLYHLPEWNERNITATEDINAQHIAVTRWILENTSEDDIIAAHDIGALGFMSGRKILDIRGLIFTPALKSKDFALTSVSSDSFAASLLKKYKPNFLVVAKSSYPFIWQDNPALDVIKKFPARNTIKCATSFAILKTNFQKLDSVEYFSKIAPPQLMNNPDFSSFWTALSGGNIDKARKIFSHRRTTIASILRNNMLAMSEQQRQSLAAFLMSHIDDDTLNIFIHDALSK